MLDLVDFEELRAVLRLQKEDLEDYPDLAAIISSVYAAIESHTGRTLEYSATHAETVWIDGRLVPLKALPVSALTAAVIDGLEMRSLASIRQDGIEFLAPLRGQVAVTYAGGYLFAPDALKRAATLQVLHEYQRKDKIGAESVSNEGGFTRWPQMGLLDEVKRLLAPFVHPARLI